MAELAKVPGITDLGAFWVLGQPNLNIKADREKAARYGLNVGDAKAVVQAALGGTTATTLLEADRQFGVVVRLAPQYRSDIDEVRKIKVGVQTPTGNAYIPLSELASITLDTGASYIFRERNQRFLPIKFSVRGRDLAGTVEEAQQRIARNVKLPTGYRTAVRAKTGPAVTGSFFARAPNFELPNLITCCPLKAAPLASITSGPSAE